MKKYTGHSRRGKIKQQETITPAGKESVKIALKRSATIHFVKVLMLYLCQTQLNCTALYECVKILGFLLLFCFSFPIFFFT